ncbi:unnamed protein product [Linum tenue]|uniref:Calcineurin-like phosphoesterase domain-containing protein n=1 Tax=Linum tenue TaxID=586396 RepID=A0AAV0INP5_9ROSI|nr:unnamed protein product [Linum tenue]
MKRPSFPPSRKSLSSQTHELRAELCSTPTDFHYPTPPPALHNRIPPANYSLRSSGRSPERKMKQYHKLTAVLCLVWMATILYGEMLAFWMPSLFSCSWPDRSPSPIGRKVSANDDYVRIAVLTDPQLMDRTSHPTLPKSLLGVAQFYTDIYMRRAFFASVLPMKPHVILFLGDYFDGGPELSDAEWQDSMHRLKHVFDLDAKTRDRNVPVFFIPGNHDIGYSSINSHNSEVVRRYEKEFGSRNFWFAIGKVEFIAVDAQTLDGNAISDITSSAWKFVKNVSEGNDLMPKILLTHIPLYRPDNTYCGPHRKSPIINQVLVLSGHDHDQCTVLHDSKSGPVREHTVGTISWQQGNLYPSFMLLSVADNSTGPSFSITEEAVKAHLCFLPIQTHIYIWYIVLFNLTILALLLWPMKGVNFEKYLNFIAACLRPYSILFKGGPKEKTDDENCEYEMVWDAEGSMHLVKKAILIPTSVPADDYAVMERGNAVMRPAAKTTTPPPEAEFPPEVDSKSSARNSRSKTKIAVQRVVRATRMVMVIAAVNGSLYMMLLFKDTSIDQ